MLYDIWHSWPVFAIKSPAFKHTIFWQYTTIFASDLTVPDKNLKGDFSHNHLTHTEANIALFIQDMFLFDGDFALPCWTGVQ
jgi:hypothetical protein